MARERKSSKKPIEQYDHKDKKRVNNPPVGLVTPDTDKETGKKTYAYDPHIDPSLQWAGKAELTSFEVPTVSLHVHERIDPRTIIEAVRKRNGKSYEQLSLFRFPEENLPLREAIQFYKHKHNWSNRLIAGDSLLVMNSLIEKEGLAGQVQMIYIDPPYGIEYSSNFQPFVNKRNVTDGKDEDLTQEPETIKAFRDTWELGIHSYLTYLRDRLLLGREILSDSGSVFVQINDKNLNLIQCLLDEVFGRENFVAIIPFRKKTMPLGSKLLEQMYDFIFWYAKVKVDSKKNLIVKYRKLFIPQIPSPDSDWSWYELPDGSRHKMTSDQLNNPTLLPERAKIYRLKSLEPSGTNPSGIFDFEFGGKVYKPPKGGWATTNMKALKESNRLQPKGELLNYVLFFDDYPVTALTSPWIDTVGPQDKRYAVQTNDEVIARCILMSTDPGDLVFDPTCGSGTTAYVAEQWGRRWITCDTSRVSITLAKQRLMTAIFDYYELARPDEGVGSGFKYKTASHITLGSVANNEPPGHETLYDQPFIDNSKARVTGPFTVEAVPAPAVKPLSEIKDMPASDESISRSGETLRQSEWRDELLKTGIRGKSGQYILFSRVEPLPGTRWLHGDAETKPNNLGADSVRDAQIPYGEPQRVVISFGPEHAPLEQRQVELAVEDARKLVPKPQIIVFASFQFDPEAAKDIDETKWPGVTLLKAQMNADLLTEDLKKKRASNDSFWLIGQPDVAIRVIPNESEESKKILSRAKDGKRGKLYQVEVLGFDYYNTKTGNIESGGTERIAMWMTDTDYDGRSLLPRQVFFPMAGDKDGWSRLAKNLKAEIDEELIEAYRGTVSLPFEAGSNKRIAIKIVDDRGIESLKIIDLE
jgi:adenine-specific DNA-methyltransferase